jgi:hypothetical protein
MFPGVYEFHWDAGHLIFLGAFYGVLLLLAAVLAAALARAADDLRRGREEEIRWRGDFSALPASSRSCRHEIAGEIARRPCPNGFDCRTCDGHARFLQGAPEGRSRPGGTIRKEEPIHGLRMPLDRLYHRGHTWVRWEQDATVTVGLDDFGARLLGEPEEVQLPSPGSRLRLHGTGFRIRSRGVAVRILSPLDGVVVERGDPEKGWYLRVRPAASSDLRHLLGGEEIRPWVVRELERLQQWAGGRSPRPALADGGSPVAELASVFPEEARDRILGEIFLDP